MAINSGEMASFVVLKARPTGVPEFVELAKMEVALYESLLRAHDLAVSKVAKVVASSTPAAKPEGAARKAFTAVIGVVMERVGGAVLEEGYRLGKLAAAKRATGESKRELRYEVFEGKVSKAESTPAEVIAALTLKDERAIEALKGSILAWIGGTYDTVIGDAVAEAVREAMLERGAGRSAAAKRIAAALSVLRETGGPKVELPGSWSGRAKQYYEGVAANVATMGRAAGAVAGLVDAEVTEFTITNPDDERTCPRCRLMIGKVIPIRLAAAQIESVAKATTPDQVKAAHPWYSVKAFRAIVPEGDITPEQAEAMANAGICIPPLHFLCRCTIDIAPGSEK